MKWMRHWVFLPLVFFSSLNWALTIWQGFVHLLYQRPKTTTQQWWLIYLKLIKGMISTPSLIQHVPIDQIRYHCKMNVQILTSFRCLINCNLGLSEKERKCFVKQFILMCGFMHLLISYCIISFSTRSYSLPARKRTAGNIHICKYRPH